MTLDIEGLQGEIGSVLAKPASEAEGHSDWLYHNWAMDFLLKSSCGISPFYVSMDGFFLYTVLIPASSLDGDYVQDLLRWNFMAAFVDQLLDELEDTLCIDPDRVYATGVGNGAMFTHRLGCDMADRFAAIAPVAGMPAKGFSCAPGGSASTSIMHLHGNRDECCPADGSESEGGWFYVPVDDVIDAWASPTSQGCDDDETPYPTSKDGTQELACAQRPDCATGAEVVSCFWAGNHSSTLGIAIHFGNNVIWEFFAKNSKQR